jgi:tripartite-type tricarboxylate transporter receptor subunit TctC
MDVAAGNVQLAFAEAGATQALIRDGRLRALAVSAQTRLTTFTEIPTMAEAIGRPDFEAVSWHALVAPSATPAAIVNRLHGEMSRAIRLPDVQSRIVGIGLIPQEPRLIEENRKYIAAETTKWGELITKLGLAGSQ